MKILDVKVRIVNNRWTQTGDAFHVRLSKSRRRAYAVFQCECGSKEVLDHTSVKTGHSKSCGCLKSEVTTKRNTSHGMSHTSTYEIWCGMIKRCTNENNHAWDRYGGRGITVCDRWLFSFENFLEDMGERPEGLSLERVRNNEGYRPDNCKWATYMEQGRNNRGNTILSANGKQMCLADWSDHCGISQEVLSRRVRLGWSHDRIINTPVRS